MLQSSFVLLKGIGPHSERRLWENGISDWQAFLDAPSLPGISPARKTLYDSVIWHALSSLKDGQSRFFSTSLKPREHWRLFDAFKSSALYLDIETTGGPPDQGDVTVVGLYQEGTMTTLVQGKDLTEDRLNEELSRCTLLVTFFGSVFDIPYLRAKFPGLICHQPHFDLCFAARRLGLEGGLKRIELTLGIPRPSDVQGLDGWEAVRLWMAWAGGNSAALEQLLRYNESDTRNLEPLAEIVFSRLVERYGPEPKPEGPTAVEQSADAR